MNQKQILQLSLFVVLFFMILLGGWFYFSKDKSAEFTASAFERNAVGDYDYLLKNDPIGINKNAKTGYYMLALSWSPAFCDTQRQRYGDDLPKSLETQCGGEKQFGWVIHGLWPQNKQARRIAEHPRFCQGDLPMVDYDILKPYLEDSPSPNLLQGEWEKHGACIFKEAQDYFAKQQALFRELALPTQELSRKELFRWVKSHNAALKKVNLNFSHNELFICYDLKWNPMDCPVR